jgi:PAS domain S-box-containing protein
MPMAWGVLSGPSWAQCASPAAWRDPERHSSTFFRSPHGGHHSMAEFGLSPSPRLAGDADVERLNGILDTMAEMVCQFRPDGKILYANEAYANMVGVSRDAMYRGTFWEFIPLAEHERIRAELASLTPASPVVTILNRINTPQGIRHTRWTNRGIKFDDRGRMIEAISTGIDMTDIAEAEEARRRSDDRFRQVVQCLPAAVYTTDAEGRINLYNKAACELWGRTPEVGIDRWCGSPKLFYADGRDMPLDQCPMARVLRSGKPVLGEEIVIERPDGTRRNVLVYPQPMFDSAGAMIGAVKMLVDITERRAMEDSLRASEEFNRSLIESSPGLRESGGSGRPHRSRERRGTHVDGD